MAIIDCPECTGKVSSLAEICPHCGFRVPKPEIAAPAAFTCPECGAAARTGAKNCTSCGYQLDGGSSATDAQTTSGDPSKPKVADDPTKNLPAVLLAVILVVGLPIGSCLYEGGYWSRPSSGASNPAHSAPGVPAGSTTTPPAPPSPSQTEVVAYREGYAKGYSAGTTAGRAYAVSAERESVKKAAHDMLDMADRSGGMSQDWIRGYKDGFRKGYADAGGQW